MIKIITGHSSYGGSTTAFINFTNMMNKNGYDCILYGPHDWHLGKCRSDMMANFKPQVDDIIIVHYLRFNQRLPAKQVILSVHEQNVFNLNTVNLDVFDKIHFVAPHQLEYHGIQKEHFIIPNVMDDLKKNPKMAEKVAGIIGTIDHNKNVHISIANALKMGFKDIRIFGNIGEPQYYNEKVLPYLKAYPNIVRHVGFIEDKQLMYDSITDVFFSSERECLPFVIGECRMTGTNLHTLKGKNYVNGKYELDNNKILEMWKAQLAL